MLLNITRQRAHRQYLDGFVGVVVGGLKLAVWTFKVGLVVEAAIRDGSAEPFMKEQK